MGRWKVRKYRSKSTKWSNWGYNTVSYHSCGHFRIFVCVVPHPTIWLFFKQKSISCILSLHTMYYLWTYVVTPKGMSISYSTYSIIRSIGPLRIFGPTLLPFFWNFAHTTQKSYLICTTWRNEQKILYCFVPQYWQHIVLYPRVYYSHVFSDETSPPRGQKSEQDEIKKLK